MADEFSRMRMLIGSDKQKKLSESSVIVFGAGGVGSYVIEALVRGGIGKIGIVDNDTVSLTNINRQLIALHSTVGQYKTEVCAKRINDINPDCRAKLYTMFYSEENAAEIDLSEYDYIVDAIDSVPSKLFLASESVRLNIPLISSMGTGNKLFPHKLKITDISKTHTCPLAKVMRYELRKRGINHLKVLFSEEKAVQPMGECEDESGKGRHVGSVSFVPSCAGLMIAGEVIRDIAGIVQQ